jgi:hypothetical protein
MPTPVVRKKCEGVGRLDSSPLKGFGQKIQNPGTDDAKILKIFSQKNWRKNGALFCSKYF